jgi:hypothetical protein
MIRFYADLLFERVRHTNVWVVDAAEPVQTRESERAVAIMKRQPPGIYTPWSKRLSLERFFATQGRAVSNSALAGAALVVFATLAAGCSGDDGRAVQTPAADAAPMLPGTRSARASQADAIPGAQRFDTAGAITDREARKPLLPPVMHTAD